MYPFRKFAAITFAILFVITAVFAIIAFNFDRRAFTPETYQKAFAKEDFYNKLPAIMADAMVSSSADESGFPVVMRDMTPQAWEAFFRAILPPEAFKVIGDNALNSLFDYLNMKTNSAEISLIPLKTSMTGDQGVQAVFVLLATQPDCTLSQLGAMALGMLSEQEMLVCNPPSELTPLLTPVIQAQLQAATIAIPDQVTLASADETNDPRQRLKFARLLMLLSPLMPLGFLLLFTILAVNSLNSWLKWWGISFAATGFTVTVMSLSGAPVIGVILKYFITKRAPAYLPPAFSNYAGEVATAMVEAITMPIFWQGLILLLLGLGMVLILAMMFIVRKVTQK